MLDGADFLTAQDAIVCEATNIASNWDPCRAQRRRREDRDHKDVVRVPIASIDRDNEQWARLVGVSGPAWC